MEITEGRAESLMVPGEVVPQLYSVYCSDDSRPQLEQTEWVIKGTDGKFYLVPSAPGGWLRHAEYQGERGKLIALAQNDARGVCWMVYGDVGRVTMEGAEDLLPR
jgi:hypothetical protein